MGGQAAGGGEARLASRSLRPELPACAPGVVSLRCPSGER